jgi:allantoin racemase
MRLMYLKHFPENPADKEKSAAEQAQVRGYASPGTEIDLCFPDDYPGARVTVTADPQVLPGLHHILETPALVRKVVWAEQNGYDAVIQSNTFDPGVEACRQAVHIPVIGVTRATLHIATILHQRVAVAVPLESHVAYTWEIIRAYGMQERVATVRPVGMYGQEVSGLAAQVFARTLETIQSIIQETDARCVIPLGGAVYPSVVSPADLEREAGVPVLNTRAVGIRFAELCAQLGLSHSSRLFPPANVRYEDFAALAYD